MKAESWKIRFSGKCNVMREKNSRLFKIARLPARLDQITSEPICRSRKNESVRADKTLSDGEEDAGSLAFAHHAHDVISGRKLLAVHRFVDVRFGFALEQNHRGR